MLNPNGRFGGHGGQYVPETLMNAIIELEEAYNYYKANPDFQNELTQLLNDYAGRPSRLYYAEKMTKDLGGAKIYLKREDLNHTAEAMMSPISSVLFGTVASLQYLISRPVISPFSKTRSLDIKLMSWTRMCSL